MTDEKTNEMISRAEALRRAEARGVSLNERTLDRYRDQAVLTTHRPPDRPFVVELSGAEVERLLSALAAVEQENPPEARRLARIRELMTAPAA